MQNAPSLSVRLFGTEQPVTPPRTLAAGRLSAELESGNLRHIRYAGVEMIRAISFIVRDKDWGTYEPVIEDLKIEEGAERFRVSYNAVARDESAVDRSRLMSSAPAGAGAARCGRGSRSGSHRSP